MTVVKCRAKDPATCRVHGTNPVNLPDQVLYSPTAWMEINNEIDALQTFIKSKAAQNILDYNQYEKIQQEIVDYKWKYQVTVDGYKRAYEDYVQNPTPERKAKLDMVEEARTEFETKHPVAFKQINQFNTTIQKYGEQTYNIPSTSLKKTDLQELYTKLENLPTGQKFALEFYDGSRLIRTVEEQPTGWKEKLGLSKKPVNNLTAEIPPLTSFKHITAHEFYLSLGKTKLGTSLDKVKTLTILKPGTPETFTETEHKNNPPAPTKTTKGFFQIKTPELEGIFYQAQAQPSITHKDEYVYSSADNFYELTGSGTITKIS